MTELVKRVAKERKLQLAKDDAINTLFVLMSFDTFDALAGPTRTPEDVIPVVRRLVRLITGA